MGTRRLHTALLLVLVTVTLAIVVLAGYSALGHQFNENVNDWFFRLRGTEKFGTSGIVVVALDDDTLTKFGNIPIDRGLIARALENVCQARPRAVALDLLFDGPSNPESDAALQRALKDCGNAVLSARLAKEDVSTLEAAGWSEPLPDFAKVAAGIGHAHAEADVDGVCRRVLLAKSAAKVRHWSLAMEALRVTTGYTSIFEPDANTLVVGDYIIRAPVDAASGPGGGSGQRALRINYAGPEGSFPRVSFARVVVGAAPASDFAGRAVLFGVTAQAAGDHKFTPFSTLGRDMAGVEIHANALRTLETGRFLNDMRDSTALAVVLGIGAVVAGCLIFLRGAPLAVALLVAGLAAHIAPYQLFTRELLVTPAFSFALAFWLPLVVGGAFQYRTVWRGYQRADETSRRLRGGLEMVAHEIRSPLNTIQGSGEVISRYPLDDERRKQLGDLVSRESQRIATMVGRFLDVERLEAGELKLHRVPVALDGVVDRTVERIRPAAARKRIHIEVGRRSQVETDGDAELLEFAVYNLLSNAVKYSPEESSIEIRVGRNPVLKIAFIEVHDHGEGISREDQAKIFDRFFRTASAQRSAAGGLGLGLSLVKEIMRHHDGSVRLESEPGKGSRFTLVLPLRTAAATAQA